MKRVNVLLISLVHLLLAFSSSPCTTAQVVVRDVDGDILRPDTRYFVMVAPNLGAGGGVRRGPLLEAEDGADDANFECSSQVVQSPLQMDPGIPVYFKPKAVEQVEITESTSLNIEFYDGNSTEICNNTLWEAEGYPGTIENPAFLSTNGVTGNPSTWFQINKFNDYSNVYRLMFCPDSEERCSEIFIYYFDGQRRLTVKWGYRFPIVFVKDNSYAINSII